jgi:hypothetical protein
MKLRCIPLSCLQLAGLALCCTLVFQANVGSAQSATPELSADEIAKRALRADAFAWEGAKTRLRMVLLGSDGKRQERALEVVARRQSGLLQTLVRFLAPTELAGTAFLSLEQKGSTSEQYIYLSGLRYAALGGNSW